MSTNNPVKLDRPFALALEIADLRTRLAAKEAEWDQLVQSRTPRPVKPARGSVRPAPEKRQGPSISQRVLNIIENAGPEGIARQDLVNVVGGHAEAVHSALKQHQRKGLIAHSDATGKWVATPVPQPVSANRETRPIRIVQPDGQ